MGGAVTHRLHRARLGRCYDSFPEVHGIAARTTPMGKDTPVPWSGQYL
jgi:hypothetical protein